MFSYPYWWADYALVGLALLSFSLLIHIIAKLSKENTKLSRENLSLKVEQVRLQMDISRYQVLVATHLAHKGATEEMRRTSNHNQ